MRGLYATGDDEVCVCGHAGREHERFGFKKPCLAGRCGCADLTPTEVVR